MEYVKTALQDAYILQPKVFGDERGFFLESFRHSSFVENCGDYSFVQDNHSKSKKGILRGLHYQLNRPQGKLVRVTSGEVYDVIVDLRQSSSSYGQWIGVTLNATNMQMLWVPPGFAHGFYTVSDEAEFQYKCTDYYNPGDEYSILWNDQELAINWPCDALPVLSLKDAEGMSYSNAPKLL